MVAVDGFVTTTKQTGRTETGETEGFYFKDKSLGTTRFPYAS
jgi:hypothetical protein